MIGEPNEQNNELIFQDALHALRRGDKARAKELLTLILKSDQNNPIYWIWLSAAVDSKKERIYCLQTALQLDPENVTAKRGLILMGALAPDDSIQPFPMHHARGWEEKLLLANEKPKVRTSILKNPILRLAGITLIGLGLCTYVFFGLILPRQNNIERTQTPTPGPSPTFTATPTLVGATAIPTRMSGGPTPLWAYLPQTYTPTPLYVITPRSPASIDQYRIAVDAYEKGDWDAFILNMELIRPLEPDSADIPYYIGEAYRFKGEANAAIRYYDDALDIDDKFAPAYLGLARANIMRSPNYNAESLFNDALEFDPFYGEAYLERARFYLRRGDIKDALEDLEKAQEYLPGSSEVYLTLADAYLADEDIDRALTYAEEAYALDITNLSTYKLLSDLYIQTKDYPRALDALQLYTNYALEDATAFAKLGMILYRMGDYEQALRALDRAVDLNPNGVRDYYIYRGLSNVELGNGAEAIDDFIIAVEEDDRNYEARIGYARANYLDKKFGTAFLQIEVAIDLAETDEENALAYYWLAKIQEQRGDIAEAIEAWEALLDMDEDAMTPEMRTEAETQLDILVPPTRTPKSGAPTSTPTVGNSTSTPSSLTPTRTPTRTPSPTPTP
ncbi:MAG: serine/threonine protein kinase [Chloroflexi bacterium OLB14]|nr:MAG: serine/threonine protein kinase [Chloroflexi bacterium OLB14]